MIYMYVHTYTLINLQGGCVQTFVDAGGHTLHQGCRAALHNPRLVHVDSDTVWLAGPGIVSAVPLVLQALEDTGQDGNTVDGKYGNPKTATPAHEGSRSA